MKRTRCYGMLLCLAWGFLMAAGEGLVDPPVPPRSPEGRLDLKQLHEILIMALGDERMDRRFQALTKIRQLEADELSRELVSAIVESLAGDNHNYLWFAAHTLKRISGKDLGTNRESWRQWLRTCYVDPSAPPPAPSCDPPSAQMGSGSQGHDNAGGVPPLDVEPSDALGHDPNAKVVEDRPKEGRGTPTSESPAKDETGVQTEKGSESQSKDDPDSKGAVSKP